MRFMMNIRVQFPGTWTPEQRAEERQKETMHALEHMHNGIIKRVFRIPGQYGNFSIWEVDSHEHLHELISGMPANPWMNANMTPIIEPEIHRLYRERYGELPPI
jgi:muconolactone D-isomerase